MFLRDLEEDEELRGTVQLFKNGDKAGDVAMMDESDVEDAEEDFPEIDMSQLMDEMTLDAPEGDGDESE